MTTTALIEPPASAEAPDPRLAGFPPLLDLVPVAGPPAFVLLGFGVVLLLLLVPPLALVATLIVVAAALAAVVALVGAILAAPFLLVRHLRGHRLHRFHLPVAHLHKVNVRRV